MGPRSIALEQLRASCLVLATHILGGSMEFLMAHELDILRWLHILAMVYWLGAEWGVYQLSLGVTDRSLPLNERRRYVETVHRIDVLQRTGLVLLLPLGLHMGVMLGFVPCLSGAGIWWVWLLAWGWMALGWIAYRWRGTDKGLRVTRVEEFIRYPLITVLLLVALLAFQGKGPIVTGHGALWYPAKIALYAITLSIGLFMRFIVRSWTKHFQALEQGPNPQVEAALNREIGWAKKLAWIYWFAIAATALVGSLKPF